MEAKPESVGISSEKLKNLDNFINYYMFTQAVPGGTFMIVRKGKIVYYKSFGKQDLDGKSAYANDDIYRLASMTKAITSVAIMQLLEEGKLGLDDPIHYYIPAYKQMKIATDINQADSTYNTKPATKEITIRHLLTHTSGITYGPFNPGAVQAMYDEYGASEFGLSHETMTTAEMVDQLAKVPLMFEPGEKWMYGLNMEVLGRIVEVLSGMELDEYFAKNIFEPLGMDDTYFHIPNAKQDRLVPVYSYDDNGKWITLTANSGLGNVDYPKMADNNHYAGGGGLSGTTEDYMIFLQALINNGKYNGKRILGRKSIETMVSDQLVMLNKEDKGISPRDGVTFGLSFMVLDDDAEGENLKSAGTYEWGGYFNTKYFVDPKEELTFVGMTQIVPFARPDFWDRIYNIIYASIDD